MLHPETVEPGTLELLTSLMNDQLLNDFFLVGGTALALQIGHRRSIDLDLFNKMDFDEDELLTKMEEAYSFTLDYRAKNTLKGEINGVKVDFISHKYPLVSPLIINENIRMACLHDIAAMKINAISGNGTRLKDFVDIAYLSGYLTLIDMIDAYKVKYGTRNPVIAIKSLGYFLDIDFSEPILVIDGKYSWKAVEKRLSKMLDNPGASLGLMVMDEK